MLLGNACTTPSSAVGASTTGAVNFWGTTDAKNLAVATNGVTRMISDTAGNAYGITKGSYAVLANNAGGNNRNFIRGRAAV